MDERTPQKSFFENFSPKANFLLGIGTMIGLTATVGFFVLLGVMLKDADASATPVRAGDSPSPVAAAPLPASAPAPSGDISVAPVSDEDWVRGDRDAAVSIIEFSDLECPFCKRFHPTMQRVIAEYAGDVKWVYRHFPLASLHPKAPKEAEATECAGELGGNEAFWAYVDRLFELTPSNNGLDAAQLPQIASDIGLDRNAFAACLDSGKYADKVQAHYNQAVAAGGRGTPYSVLITQDGTTIPISGAQPYEQVRAVIDSVL